MLRFFTTKDYVDWLETITTKEEALLNSRLLRIQEHHHFGDFKNLGDGLFELRWKNGLRVYYSLMEDQDGKLILLLLGGRKSTQKNDIKRSRSLLKENIEE